MVACYGDLDLAAVRKPRIKSAKFTHPGGTTWNLSALITSPNLQQCPGDLELVDSPTDKNILRWTVKRVGCAVHLHRLRPYPAGSGVLVSMGSAGHALGNTMTKSFFTPVRQHSRLGDPSPAAYLQLTIQNPGVRLTGITS